MELFMTVERELREEREEIDSSSSEDEDVPHTKVFEMPFVVRGARTSREEVRRNLGVLPDAKLLVLMLGGLSGDASWSVDGDDTLPAGWVCGVTAPAWPEGAGLGDRFFRLPHDAYLPDIILASDAVIGSCVAPLLPSIPLRSDPRLPPHTPSHNPLREQERLATAACPSACLCRSP